MSHTSMREWQKQSSLYLVWNFSKVSSSGLVQSSQKEFFDPVSTYTQAEVYLLYSFSEANETV